MTTMRATDSRLETARLILRPISPDAPIEVAALARVLGQPNVVRDLWFDLGAQRGFTDDEVRACVQQWSDSISQNGYGKLGVFVKGQSGQPRELVGYCGLLPLDIDADGLHNAVEIGYRLDPSFQGQGFATEAAEAVLQDGFSRLGLSKVVAILNEDNQGSARVLEKLGFVDWTEFTFHSDVAGDYLLWKCEANPTTFELAREWAHTPAASALTPTLSIS